MCKESAHVPKQFMNDGMIENCKQKSNTELLVFRSFSYLISCKISGSSVRFSDPLQKSEDT